MDKLTPIICIILFFSILLMLLTYPQFEANQENNLKWSVGEYDGTLSGKTMMIVEQCKDQEQNPFADYGFEKYSNGHYYIDNVICELINVEKGGCIEPVYNEDSDVIECTNYVSYDYPYGETGPEFNEEFCNAIYTEPLAATDTIETKFKVKEWVNICIERFGMENEN